MNWASIGGGLALLFPAVCLPEEAARLGWGQLDAGPVLTLSAPPGTNFRQEPGADSYLGVFTGPGFRLYLDFGAYSDPLENGTEHIIDSAEKVLIDGHPGRLVTGRWRAGGNRYPEFIGVHVTGLGRTAVGELSATLSGEASDGAARTIIRDMFQSIRFKSVQR
jgi:hypothetical protein